MLDMFSEKGHIPGGVFLAGRRTWRGGGAGTIGGGAKATRLEIVLADDLAGKKALMMKNV